MSEDKRKFSIGLFGFLTILAALLIFLWLLTFQDSSILYPLTTASFFLIGGLSLSFAIVGIQLKPFNLSNFLGTVISTIVNVVTILYVNTLIPIRFEFATLDPRLFGVLIGVAEECFFRLFLCGLFWRFTRNFLITILGSSAIWSSYHVARYGVNLNILGIIFICGCILGATFLYTRSGDGSIFGHAVVNYIAIA